MFEPLGPPEGFTWKQEDALLLVHEECGQEVSAEVVDIHLRAGCPARNDGSNGGFGGP